MHIEVDRALIPVHTSTTRHLTVSITAPPRQQAAQERLPVSVALVLDRSGSMAGRKIKMARAAVAHAIQLLAASDHLAVVVYDDRVDTLLASTPADENAKRKATDSLRRTGARGSTDLAAGWFEGVAQAARPSQEITRVLLLTDGLANQGLVDHDELTQAAARFRSQGVMTTTFGVGADFDEQLLSRLATEGGGHFYFIEEASQIPDFLASEIGETLEVTARNVVLSLSCSIGIVPTVHGGYAVDAYAGGARVTLGDLVAGQSITLVVSAVIPAAELDSMRFMECRLSDQEGALSSAPMRMEWQPADADANAKQPVNAAVLVAVAGALAERARLAALAANRGGHYERARQIIADTIERLRALAPANRQIEQIAELIATLQHDQAEFGQPMEPLRTKARHFASYAAARSRDAGGRASRGRS